MDDIYRTLFSGNNQFEKINIEMENIGLRMATKRDKPLVVAFDSALDKEEHIKLNREEKIKKAILDGECFIIIADEKEVGFVIFDYRFFDLGWIELIIIDKEYRGYGIGGKVFDLICQLSKTDKIFTSTNKSNTPMQRALAKADFTFSGELIGLDDGDPELFFYKRVKSKSATN